ncbi:efflux transporter outer membrane subunit [Methylomonas sp. AM2-LC]|uniref:efflux transporter outer membrane subunit n=1 Tax=Methylomonas sp. AM2-LC TaxID=3153301 RepID=UPI0032635F0E
MMTTKQNYLMLFSLSLLTACSTGLIATVGPDYSPPSLSIADHWQAPQPEEEQLPLAHQGQPDALLHWWERFNDTTLNQFLQSAENASYSVANAASRIEQARASLIGADSAFLPTLDGNLGATRSSFSIGGPAFYRTQYQAGLQSSWELDLFGGLARQTQASQSQLESRNASWHDARVAVAVEVANAYLSYRYCEVQVQQLQADSESRQVASNLLDLAQTHGFRSLADTSLSHASLAEAKKTLLQKQGQCERSIKGLVALTALDENTVRQSLQKQPELIAKLPAAPAFKLDSVPAHALLQRPDLAAAERDVAEASANIGVEQAKRYPKLSLSGNITPTLQSMNGAALALAQTWSIGPTLSLPLFDAGKRAANVDSMRAQYEAAVSNYHSKVRTAVKEVEEALVRLDTAAQSIVHARQAASAYQQSFQASRQLFENGLGSLIDLETSRRNQLSSELAVKDLEQEQVSAWIALYRAAGGSWEEAQQSTSELKPIETSQPNVQPPTSTNPQQSLSGEKS